MIKGIQRLRCRNFVDKRLFEDSVMPEKEVKTFLEKGMCYKMAESLLDYVDIKPTEDILDPQQQCFETEIILISEERLKELLEIERMFFDLKRFDHEMRGN